MIRQKVLQELEAHRGKQISGGMLAKQLGVSRAAIWKAISALRSEGMNIVSVTGGGYCLSSDDDTINAEGIHALRKSKIMGRSLVVIPEVTSTNTVLRQDYPDREEGFSVIATRQTAGKGRMGRVFTSPDGGVYISILLRPNISLENLSFLTILAAVAVCQAIEKLTDLKPQIKWVNDVLINGKKICGILTEASIEGETGNIDHVVIGIGVNVRTDILKMPDEVRNVAGSLAQLCKKPPRRAEVIAALLETFENGYNILCSENGQCEILKLYENRLCCKNETIEVYTANERYNAICKGVNSAGNLIIEKSDGTISVLQAGEIRIRTRQMIENQ